MIARWSVSVVVLLASVTTPARGAEPLRIPVDGPISHGFVAPSHTYGPGHRGIDLSAAAGTPVRAAASGRIVFAGSVPGGTAVTIEHADGMLTSYSLLAEIGVNAGDEVVAGQVIGVSGDAHPGKPGLHFGVRIEGRYVDPAPLIVSVAPRDALGLVPVTSHPVRVLGRSIDLRALTGRTVEPCRGGPSLGYATDPPNDNIAVTVGGLGSDSRDPVLFDLPYRLGYRADDVVPFSYRGVDGDDLHPDYRPVDTYGDIEDAAGKLVDLLVELGRRHPGRGIDLLAHSQGGLVVRTALELVVGSGMPPVEHVVTFASPHKGAPLAETAIRWDRATGGLLHELAGGSGIGPPPGADAVRQLAPRSAFLEALGEVPPVFGARMLTVAIPNDVVVPVDRALAGDKAHVVAPRGLHGHSSILGSAPALGTVFDHLRDAPRSCTGFWDAAGPWIGRLVGGFEWMLGAVAPVPP